MKIFVKMIIVIERVVVGATCLMSVLPTLPTIAAEPLPLDPIEYIQDFEAKDSCEFWCSDGPYAVNYKGLTDEKASAGKKSLKLDITSTGGSWFIFKIPITPPVPVEGTIKATVRILLAEESDPQTIVAAGIILSFPPTTLTDIPVGFGRRLTEKEKNKWICIESLPLKMPTPYARSVLYSMAWGGIDERNVGHDIASVYIRLSVSGRLSDSGKNRRIVVYVDDVALVGEAPKKKDYDDEIAKRWKPAGERIAQKCRQWEEAFEKQAEQLTSLDDSDLNGETESFKEEAEETLRGAQKQVREIRKRGWISAEEQTKMDPLITKLDNAIACLRTTSLFDGKSSKYRVHVVNPISSDPILPLDRLVRGRITDEIKITACPGEYEPASFVVYAMENIENLTLSVSDLKDARSGHVVPSANVDVKVVKCWYQSGSAWININQDKRTRILVPELLLNDEQLVKVDHQKKDNYLKLTFPDHEKYEWISNPDEKPTRECDFAEGNTIKLLKTEEFPVRDAAILLPVNIPRYQNCQFWLTMHVPNNTRAGLYAGTIRLKENDTQLGELKLTTAVLPIDLLPPYYTPSLYYMGNYVSPGGIGSGQKSAKQFKADLDNMFKHGVTCPAIVSRFDEEHLGAVLKMMNEAGMGKSQLYCFTKVYRNLSPSNPLTETELLELRKKVKEVQGCCRNYGYFEVYFYGEDEATGDGLKIQRPAWEAIREEGGRIFVTAAAEANFDPMGDIQDLLVKGGYPSKNEAEKWHSVGHKIWNYANPQGGVENPEVYRRNFGLLMWKCNYDGIATWAYQGGYGNIWNDFDDAACRDACFTYPAVDGPIDTIAWEGYREAIDDVRYLTTLLRAIAWARKSEDKGVRALALVAETYLDSLDINRDLDAIRSEMIGFILKLTGNGKYVEILKK